MLIAILNHEHSDAALALKAGFSAHAPVVAIDSGSRLSADQRGGFDLCLPNVYYCGLLNAVAACSAELPGDEPVYCWASDVSFADPAAAVRHAASAFADPRVGTYAPSAWFSGHRQMWNRRTGGLRRTSFVEGFCFATRAAILRALCPIDTAVNAMGWGVDIHLGYLTRRRGWRVVVDDRLQVSHPQHTGYSTEAAKRQRQAWVARLPPLAQRYHRMAGWDWARRRPLDAWFGAIPWGRGD